MALDAGAATAAPPEVVSTAVSGVTSTAAVLEASINPQGRLTRWHFEYGAESCAVGSCSAAPIPEGEILAGDAPALVSIVLEKLSPGTLYHYRVSAKNGEGGTIRSGESVFATSGVSFAGLPDGRAYEQSSPVDKDGEDAVGKLGLVKASANGNGISFGSTFGVPGGLGAQSLPSYLASRDSNWSTQGLLPPAGFGERAQVQGWLPDFSATFSNAAKLRNPRVKALVMQSTTGGEPEIVSPYTPAAEYSYAGATNDASTVIFESEAKLPPEDGEPPIQAAVAGRSNVYAWDRASGQLSLVSMFNDGTAPHKGAFAGPYQWSSGTNTQTLGRGGAARDYYLRDTHAVTASGDVYFTEAGTGQLYLRLNPIRPQSELDGKGHCTKAVDACTVHVSASKRSTPDSAGTLPAAFQAASVDGSQVFFTSSEKLTNDANTGPEQPEAAIGLGAAMSGAIENTTLVKRHTVGVAVDEAHIYWADPASGVIGRSDLDGNDTENFIEVGTGECEMEAEPGVLKKVAIPSSPRYVAVDAKYVYWTNTGLRDKESGNPIDGGGTIGRAEINSSGEAVNIDPDFICGEVEDGPGGRKAAVSNPQGIAVNADHIYWANAADNHFKRSIARAGLGGGGIEAEFLAPPTLASNVVPRGVALADSHVYFAAEEPGPDDGFIERVTLDGKEIFGFFIGKAGVRGVAINGGNLYWTTQGEGAIGRVPVADLGLGGCKAVASCNGEFVKPVGTLNGLAVNASHLYWSVNGESASNSGNDLYRYESATDMLKDLTPLPEGNGAEVQGVLGVSSDGSHVYFAANGVLDEGATKGDCQTSPAHGPLPSTSGSCNIYFWHQGTVDFVGRVRGADAADWTGTPKELFGELTSKSSLGAGGQVLLFRSTAKLTDYENKGGPELYRYSASAQTLACVSCPPSGEAVGSGPSLGSDVYPGPLTPPLESVNMLVSRNLSSSGNRAFFQTAEALVPGDTNGQAGCPFLGKLPACLDVYEWEASGTGTCAIDAPGYSSLNEGCVYLISTGKSPFPSVFADASESGDDVFFFTRQGLVGQDTDELQDVYDARVGGGLASQNPPPPNPCLSTEACHEGTPPPPAAQSAGTETFVGPGNQAQKHKKPKTTNKGKKSKKHKQKKKGKGKKQHK